MNLSCSGGGLPESGCLFFKVAGNTSTMIGIYQLIVVIAMNCNANLIMPNFR